MGQAERCANTLGDCGRGALHVATYSGEATRDSRRKRSEPEGRRGGQSLLLRFVFAPGSSRQVQRGRGYRERMDGPRMVHAPTGARTNRMGLVQRATGQPDGVDVVPTAPEGW